MKTTPAPLAQAALNTFRIDESLVFPKFVYRNEHENFRVGNLVSRSGRKLARWLIALSIGPFAASALQAQDLTLQAYGSAFQANLPQDWAVQPGGWSYLNVADCFVYGPSCYGNNPSTPYGSPTFIDPTTQLPSSILQMNADEAVVIIFRSPPTLRYFGFTQYMMNKGVTTLTVPVYASLGDTVNNLKIGTTGSPTNGTNVFNQYAAVVWTGDTNTFATVQATLVAAGLPANAVNLVALPASVPSYTLHTGYGPGLDSYQMLMRTALPTDPAAYQSYLQEQPFIVQKVGPTQHLPPSPGPTTGYATETTGVLEDPTGTIAKNLTTLANTISKYYGASYTFTKQTVTYSSRVGWDCITGDVACNGDNHDALYSADTGSVITFKGLDDFIMVVGLNHQKTGKAMYLNHSVYDSSRNTGIVAVDDTQLTSASALYHAGITKPKDPRAATFANMYAYMITYHCNGRLYCMEIPPPTATNPVGLTPGAPFFVLGRSYSNPVTTVRPSSKEVVQHKVFLATKK